MNHTHLERSVCRLAAELGYRAATGANAAMQSALPPFPAAWLSPVELHEIEGRRHGRIVYNVVLRLMRSGMKSPHTDRAAVWARLEEDLLELFSRLSDEEQVIAVEGLTITPAAGTLTSRGELSQTATARIVTFF